MDTKTCFKCHETKPIDEFYKHTEMADGHLGKCKSCTKSDVSTNYRSNHDHYVAYERERASRPERRSNWRVYQANKRERSPEKYKARNAVSNALRDGRLIKQPCKVCGDPNTEAHHKDYSKPLDVEWFCFKHHRSVAHGQIVSAVNF